MAPKYILWFKETRIEDVPRVGGKNASLGEMYQELTVKKGIRIPNGFAVTAQAYFYFLEAAGIRTTIKDILDALDATNTRDLEVAGANIRQIIMDQKFPDDLTEEILTAYHTLSQESGTDNTDVAVRSSATAEDLPDASFAGQQETFLNVQGDQQLLLDCKRCMASLFTNRAISYRVQHGFSHFMVGLSVCVQKMVRSDLASSGVMFSIDTESGYKNVVQITGSYGLGENIVQGNVSPDEFYVFKPHVFDEKLKPVISHTLGSKQFRMIYSKEGTSPVKNIRTQKQDAMKFCITDDEVLTLARWATLIEEHYTKKRGKYTPMDMEWAKDGNSGDLFIVQARPETVHSQDDKSQITTYERTQQVKDEEILAKGQSVGSKISFGKAHIINDLAQIHTFKEGEVLVTEMTDPDWQPIMKKASAIVTNRGGRTCHAAIISRELGLSCVVGCGTATETIPQGQEITVDCSAGDKGYVMQGKVPFTAHVHNLKEIPETDTKVMVILGNPDLAYDQSFFPTKGVGLARMEFMVMNHIKVHPLALLHPEVLTPDETRHVRQIMQGYTKTATLFEEQVDATASVSTPPVTTTATSTTTQKAATSTLPDGAAYFVNKLAEGVATICAAFHPHDVILRFSDFKTNEYRNLIGGIHFEPQEDNPMLGWRGASRYYDERYKEGFALECAAVKKVRDEFGLTNLVVMIPFMRTVDEARKVLDTMATNGLKKGENGLRVYGMCEIPSNVILAEQFLDLLDGFSIGSNDLTQLTLGIDRDSEQVAHLYDERNEAVKYLIKSVIKVAKEKGKYIGICGQAPSDHPELCDFLVDEGIGSISLTSDRVLPTIVRVAKREAENKSKGKQN